MNKVYTDEQQLSSHSERFAINLAYCAGLFDGEGCITTNGCPTGFRLSVTNTDKRLLDFLCECLGGYINNQYLPDNPKWSVAWKWLVTSKSEVYRILSLLEPHLVSKKDQALLVMNFIERYPNRRGEKMTPEKLEDWHKTKDSLARLKRTPR